jgi:molybdenum cofactor cytidylyltransferase
VASVERLAVALLAAGRSTRFGETNKLAADLGGRPLLSWAAQAGLSIGADCCFIVNGPEAPVPADGYTRLTNADPAQGMASSLRIAAEAAEQARAAALLILLADVPFVQTDHLERLLSAYAKNDDRPVFSMLPSGVPQPPALFPASRFAALQALEGDKGARGLANEAILIETTAESLLDIDTPADLDNARSRLSA